MNSKSLSKMEVHILENIQAYRLQLIDNIPLSNHSSQPNKNTNNNFVTQYQFAGTQNIPVDSQQQMYDTDSESSDDWEDELRTETRLTTSQPQRINMKFLQSKRINPNLTIMGKCDDHVSG